MPQKWKGEEMRKMKKRRGIVAWLRSWSINLGHTKLLGRLWPKSDQVWRKFWCSLKWRNNNLTNILKIKVVQKLYLSKMSTIKIFLLINSPQFIQIFYNTINWYSTTEVIQGDSFLSGQTFFLKRKSSFSVNCVAVVIWLCTIKITVVNLIFSLLSNLF